MLELKPDTKYLSRQTARGTTSATQGTDQKAVFGHMQTILMSPGGGSRNKEFGILTTL